MGLRGRGVDGGGEKCLWPGGKSLCRAGEVGVLLDCEYANRELAGRDARSKGCVAGDGGGAPARPGGLKGSCRKLRDAEVPRPLSAIPAPRGPGKPPPAEIRAFLRRSSAQGR